MRRTPRRRIAVVVAVVTVAAVAAAACSSENSDDSGSGTTTTTATSTTSSSARPAATQSSLPDAFTAVLVRPVSSIVAPVVGDDGKSHVVYELEVTNGKAVSATIDKLEVLDGAQQSQVLQTLAGPELAAATFQLDARPAADTSLAQSQSKVVFVELTLDADRVPARLVHRLTGSGATSPASRSPQPISYLVAEIPLDGSNVPSLAAPLRGTGWVATNGCCGATGRHRSALQTVNGELVNSQRFAIDWQKIDDQGRFFTGDQTRVENWVGYDQPVYAVADGVITSARNDLPDQLPPSLPDPSTITIETVDGNHVVIDMGNGLSVFYAHFKMGSVVPKVGDRVRAGQEIGKLGNSGNTSAPHLHLHVMAGRSVLGSTGVPNVFSSFSLIGAIDPIRFEDAPDESGTWGDVGKVPVSEHRRELPLNLHIVSWPDSGVSGSQQ